MNSRRNFIKQVGIATAGFSMSGFIAKAAPAHKRFFELSLAEFSFATSLYRGELSHLDFAAKAKKDFGITQVEYVSGFWKEKPTDREYLSELKKRSDDAGVKNN